MNRYLMIRRLRWPVMLVLTGVLLLLQQAGLLRFFHMWPLYLISWGVLLLAERAAIHEADMPPYPGPMGGPMGGPAGAPYGPPGTPYAGPMPGVPAQGAAPVSAAAPVPAAEPVVETSIVPAHGDEITHRDSNGGSNGDPTDGSHLSSNGGVKDGDEL